MKVSELYSKQIDQVLYSNDASAQYAFLNSLIRSVLQSAAFPLLEYCHGRVNDLEQTPLPELAQSMLSPADGELVRALSTAIPLARQSGFNGCGSGWFTATSKDERTLVKRVGDWVKHRNDHPGHGVVAANIVAEGLSWIPALAKDLVAGLESLLPNVDDAGWLYLHGPHGESLRLATLRFERHVPVVVRSVTSRGANWRVLYQTLDPEVSAESFYEIDGASPLVKLAQTDSRRYRHYKFDLLEDGAHSWDVAVSLPSRQTLAFTGRSPEMQLLYEWLEDLDSRVCNVYGEGGIGKTTLVLEFLNAILSREARAPSWRPEVICFFSAKETRWGPDGLQVLQGVVPTIADAAREVARVYEEPLDRSWYEGEPRAIIDRAATLLGGLGCNRNGILLVLDNSETLARSASEEEELGKLIAHLGKRLCRVLVTSRRRERLEAQPLVIPPMDEETSLVLLRQLGKEYGAKPLLQAGDASLKKMARSFGGRPLLMDVCARLIGQFSYSMDRGVDSVLRMAAGDLGAFLYEDAWARIGSAAREALLVLGQLGGTVTGELIGWACAEMHVAHGALMTALDETRFGALLDYGQHFDVTFDQSARVFLGQKYTESGPESRGRIDSATTMIRRKNEQYLRAHHNVVNDRIAQAFRTEPAKAAHKAADSGNIEEAVRWYEEAIQVDRGNGALLDRFAWFLMMQKRDYDRALIVSKQACDASPGDSEPFFTGGMAAARLGDVAQADKMIARAAEFGKATHLCSLQRAWARCHAIKRVFDVEPIDLDEASRYESAARAFLDEAVLANPVTPMELKHTGEIDRVRTRLGALRERAERLKLMRRGSGHRSR